MGLIIFLQLKLFFEWGMTEPVLQVGGSMLGGIQALFGGGRPASRPPSPQSSPPSPTNGLVAAIWSHCVGVRAHSRMREQVLDLRYNNFTEQSNWILAQQRGWDVLLLTDSHITDSQLICILSRLKQGSPSLRSTDISRTPLTVNGIGRLLESFPSLRELSYNLPKESGASQVSATDFFNILLPWIQTGAAGTCRLSRIRCNLPFSGAQLIQLCQALPPMESVRLPGVVATADQMRQAMEALSATSKTTLKRLSVPFQGSYLSSLLTLFPHLESLRYPGATASDAEEFQDLENYRRINHPVSQMTIEELERFIASHSGITHADFSHSNGLVPEDMSILYEALSDSSKDTLVKIKYTGAPLALKGADPAIQGFALQFQRLERFEMDWSTTNLETFVAFVSAVGPHLREIRLACPQGVDTTDTYQTFESAVKTLIAKSTSLRRLYIDGALLSSNDAWGNDPASFLTTTLKTTGSLEEFLVEVDEFPFRLSDALTGLLDNNPNMRMMALSTAGTDDWTVEALLQQRPFLKEQMRFEKTKKPEIVSRHKT